MTCAHSEDSDQPGYPLYVLWVTKEPNILQAESEDFHPTESSLGTWFCRAPAHFLLLLFFFFFFFFFF